MLSFISSVSVEIQAVVAALPPSVPTKLTSLLRYEAENAKSCLQSVTQITQA